MEFLTLSVLLLYQTVALVTACLTLKPQPQQAPTHPASPDKLKHLAVARNNDLSPAICAHFRGYKRLAYPTL